MVKEKGKQGASQRMKLRLEEIPAEVHERVGEALYVAQRLEWALVCHLLVLRSRGQVITPEMIDSVESELEKMTLGQLIRELNAQTGTDPSAENTLVRALKFRNHIAHHFYKSYGNSASQRVQSALMLNRLDHMALELRSAVGLMQHWTEALAFASKVDIGVIQRDYDARLSLLSSERFQV